MSSESTQRLLEEYHTSVPRYIFAGESFWNRITAVFGVVWIFALFKLL